MKNYYIEDIFINQLISIKNRLYPKTKYRIIVLLIESIHLAGIIFMVLGLFFDQKYRIYHLIFVVLQLLMFYILNNKCYLTEISNRISGKKGSVLKFRNKTIRKIMCIIIIISIFNLY